MPCHRAYYVFLVYSLCPDCSECCSSKPYRSHPEHPKAGRLLDRRMGNRNRYLNKSTKDFFALYDPATLPAGSVE